MAVSTCYMNNKSDSGLRILTPAIQKSIKSIIEKEKFINYNVITRNFDTRGDNFFGKLYEIDIMGETAKGKKELNIFVKERVDNENFKIIPIASCFAKEMFFYNDLSKVFRSLQDQAKVPQDDRYKIPKAYEETDNNAVILENLCKKGFRIYKKTDPVTIKYVKLAIQQLAKFHALTFVVEDKMSEYYNSKIKVLKSAFHFVDGWEELMRKIFAHVANLYHGEVKQKIEKFFPIFIEKFPKYYSDQQIGRRTLTFGDFKKNNLLVRFMSDEPVEIVPIDYQIMDYGCPIKDFHFFIFTSTDRAFRKIYLNEVKELYFKTLSRFLEYFDIDVETVYPREEFEKLYTDWLDYGLMLALFSSLFRFAPDTGIDFKNSSLKDIPYVPDKKYDDIFRGLIDDFVEWGCL